MMVWPLSRGLRRMRLSYMAPCVPILDTVPDWCTSKCAGALRIPYRKTPPRLAVGSGACSLKSGAAHTWGVSPRTPRARPYIPSAEPATVLSNARRVHPDGFHPWLSMPYLSIDRGLSKPRRAEHTPTWRSGLGDRVCHGVLKRYRGMTAHSPVLTSAPTLPRTPRLSALTRGRHARMIRHGPVSIEARR